MKKEHIMQSILGGMMLFSSWAFCEEENSFYSENSQEKRDSDTFSFLERPSTVPFGKIQEAWTSAGPEEGVYNVEYHKDHVMRIKIRPFVTTTIVLPLWEEISDIILGDDYFFQAEKKDLHMLSLLVKEESCDTSLTIIGKSGNIYPFYVRSEGILSPHIPDIVVYINVPGDRKLFLSKKSLEEEHQDYIKEIPFLPEELTFFFEMLQKDESSREISPLRVYSDGIWTWLDFGEGWNKKLLPSVYQQIDGVDTPVNTRIEGTKIVVHGAAPLTLKSGTRVICIRKMGL